MYLQETRYSADGQESADVRRRRPCWLSESSATLSWHRRRADRERALRISAIESSFRTRTRTTHFEHGALDDEAVRDAAVAYALEDTVDDARDDAAILVQHRMRRLLGALNLNHSLRFIAC